MIALNPLQKGQGSIHIQLRFVSQRLSLQRQSYRVTFVWFVSGLQCISSLSICVSWQMVNSHVWWW